MALASPTRDVVASFTKVKRLFRPRVHVSLAWRQRQVPSHGISERSSTAVKGLTVLRDAAVNASGGAFCTIHEHVQAKTRLMLSSAMHWGP
jgi:hypothetical protein